MKRIILVVSLLFFSSLKMLATSGYLDTTTNGGTGFGNATPSSATGFLTTNTGSNMIINGSAQQPDGKIVAVGSLAVTPGYAVIARYNINGTLDTTTFNSGAVGAPAGLAFLSVKSGGSTAYDVTIQDDGKIVVCGTTNDTESNYYFVARYLPTGLLDTVANGGSGFGDNLESVQFGYTTKNISSGNEIAYAVTMQPADQKIVVTGQANNSMFIARYTTSGILDTSTASGNVPFVSGVGYVTFNPLSTTTVAQDLAIDASGNIVVVGQITNGQGYIFIARYLTNGTIDPDFGYSGWNSQNPGPNSGGDFIAYSLDFQKTFLNPGKIVVAGTDGTNALVCRFNANGIFDTGFGNNNNAFATTFGATTAVANDIVVQADDQIIFGGTSTATNSLFSIARITYHGAGFDTNFGTTSGYTTTQIISGYSCFGNSLFAQSNGEFIVAGYTNSLISSTPVNQFAVARYLGNYTQGSMNIAYNPQLYDLYAPGFAIDPTEGGIDSSALSRITAICPSANGNIFVAAQSFYQPILQEWASNIVQLNSVGQVVTNQLGVGLFPTNDVIMNSVGQIVCVGIAAASGTNGMIQSLDVVTGTVDTPGSFSNSNDNTESLAASFQRVGQQTNDRYVVIGQSSATIGNGLLIAYNSSAVLANYSQSACPGFGTGGPSLFSGYNILPNAIFNDLLIDANDGIFVAYQNQAGSGAGAGNICIVKYLADGSAIDTSYNPSYGLVDTGWGQAAYGTPSMTFDAFGNIIIAAVQISTGDIHIQQFDTNGNPQASATILQTTSFLQTPVITKLQCDTQNNLIFTGYNINDYFVARMVVTGTTSIVLDTTFAPYSDCRGILKTMYNENNPITTNGLATPYRFSNSVCIDTLGNILFGGYEIITSTGSSLADVDNTISMVGQVSGNTIIPAIQVKRFPGALFSGTIDTTFGSGGALEVPGGLTIHPESMFTINTGALVGDILVGVNHSTTSNLAGLRSTFTLDTTRFGVESGSGTTGISPALPTTLDNINQIFTDNEGNIYVIGTNDTTTTLTKLVPQGDSIVWSASTSITLGSCVVQQASGRILIGGRDSAYNSGAGSAVIVAFNQNTGVIDTSFNQGSARPGYYYTTTVDIPYTDTVTSLSVVNATDQVVFTYANEGTDLVKMQRLLENGALDTSFPSGTSTALPSAVDFSAIKMQQDVNGKIVVVTLVGNGTASTGFTASRYHANGSDDVINVSIPVENYIGYSIFLKNILCLSDGTTLILGSNSNGNNLVLAKLTTAFALDQTFATGGILQTQVTSPVTMTEFYAIGMSAVAPYDILVTSDDGINPYLIGVVSGLNAAATQVSQTTMSWGPPGTLDVTYNANSGEEIGFVDLSNEITTNFGAGVVKAMVQNSDGSYFVVADDGNFYGGTNSYLTKFHNTDIQDTTFGNNGVVTITGMTSVNDMMLTQAGDLLLVGMQGYPNGNVVCLNPTTGALIFSVVTNCWYNYAVAQQPNGRIIIAGGITTNSVDTAMLLGLDPITGYTDPSFGNNGVYALSSTYVFAISTMVIDGNGYIYFTVNDQSNNATTFKLSPDGTTVVWTAATTLQSITTLVNSIALDQQGNVIVATSLSGINMNRYSSVDGLSLNGPLNLSSVQLGFNSANSLGLLVDQTSPTGNLIMMGIDNYDIPFVIRVVSDLSGLDITFNDLGSHPGVQPVAVTNPTSTSTGWNTGFIGANGKISVGGFATISTVNKPYLMRLYGNDFIAQYLPEITGIPGTINQGFATDGYLNLNSFNDVRINGQTPVVVIPLSNGSQYVAYENGWVALVTNANILDQNFGYHGITYTQAPDGVNSMIIDGNGCLVLAGTNGSYGWVARYANDDSGEFDPTFNNGLAVDLGVNTRATQVIEQSLARLIIAGEDINSGDATLWALTNLGVVDTTFNASITPGYYSTGSSHIIYALIADEYDRLIFAHLVDENIAITRLTSSGELDLTFGDGVSYPYSGTIAAAITSADSSQGICLTFDAAGNIVVAAHTVFFDAPTVYNIVVAAYANGTGNVQVYAPYSIFSSSSVIDIILSDLIASADGNILVSGSFVDSSPMWIACGAAAGGLNASYFNPDATAGAIPGIMQFEFDTAGTVTARGCNSIAIYPTGEISIVGYESDSVNTPPITPFMSRAYYTPYTTQELICLDSKPIGTNDLTFGVSTLSSTDRGIIFLATGGVMGPVTLNQTAQVVALMDDQNIVVGINGNPIVPQFGGTRKISKIDIILNVFDVDGLLNPNFNPDASSPCIPGQAIVLDAFDNQYAQDMLTFSVNNVNKAILAGYAKNTALGTSNSLVLQYDLTNAVLDSTFGGFNGDPVGVALGNGASQGYTLGRQSMGRIIVGGVTPNINSPTQGLFQAYTSHGLLDESFGVNGYVTQGATGIYTSVIDSQDRVIAAYSDGGGGVVIACILPDGSGVDTTFDSGSTPGYCQIDRNFLGGYANNNNFKITVDQSNNIILAAGLSVDAQSNPEQIFIFILDQNGNFIEQQTFDGSSFGSLVNFTITQLLITANATLQDEYIVIVGYDTVPALYGDQDEDQIMVASFDLAEGIGLSPLFNTVSTANPQGTPGYIKYAVGTDGNQKTAGALIHPDGRVIIAGSVNNQTPG